jgi:hypothetical protein
MLAQMRRDVNIKLQAIEQWCQRGPCSPGSRYRVMAGSARDAARASPAHVRLEHACRKIFERPACSVWALGYADL